jgi:hypothetical protein
MSRVRNWASPALALSRFSSDTISNSAVMSPYLVVR